MVRPLAYTLALLGLAGFAGDPPPPEPPPAPTGAIRLGLGGETLAESLPVLGAAYDEALRCGPNAAERRLVLLPGDRPLPEIMRQLKAFVPRKPGAAHWYRDGSGPRISTFDEDRASREARAAAGRKARAEGRARRKAALQRMRQWTDPKPKDESWPERFRQRVGGYLQLFDALPQSVQDAALDGRTARVSYPQSHAVVRAAVERRLIHPRALRGGALLVEVEPAGNPDTPGVRVLLQAPPYGGEMMEDILNQPSFTSDDFTWAECYRKYRERMRGPAGRETIPALQRRVALEAGTLASVLNELAVETTLPLIAEYDPGYGYADERNGLHYLSHGEVRNLPAWQALDVVCRDFDLDWSYHEGWIRIRSPRTVLAWAGLVDLSPPPPPH